MFFNYVDDYLSLRAGEEELKRALLSIKRESTEKDAEVTEESAVSDDREEAFAGFPALNLDIHEERVKQQDIYSSLAYDDEDETPKTSYMDVLFDYLADREREKQDFTHNAPDKVLHQFPGNHAPGLYGYTFLGDSNMWINDNIPFMSYRVQIHERIHTPDEHETRLIEDWMFNFKDNSKVY